MISFIKLILRFPAIIIFMLVAFLLVLFFKKIRTKLLDIYYNNEVESLVTIVAHEVDVFSFFLYLGVTLYLIKTIYFI